MVSTKIQSDAFAWLQSLSNHMVRLDEYRRRIEPRLASEFSVLRYLRTDEMGLSKILADLLDPEGPHGQGNRFLQCFLERHWPKLKDIENSKVKVRTEVSTDRIARRQRRIDIEVDLGTAVLGIENKPWAGDQQGQIPAYVQHLERSGREIKLIYLSGQDERLPSKISISQPELEKLVAEGKLELISYRQLRDWLRDCLRCCENERVSMFLRDLDDFVTRQVAHEGVDFETNLILETALASESGVHAAMQLAAIGSEMRLYLLARLREQLKITVPGILLDAGIREWKLQIPKPLNEKGAAVELSRSDNSALMLSLAFEKPNCQDCAFGVIRRDAKDTLNYEQLQKLLSPEFGVSYGKIGEWWGWWRPFDPRYWWYEPRIWMQIAGDALARRIGELFVQMIQALEGGEASQMFESESRGTQLEPDHPTEPPASELTRSICASAQLVGHLLAVEAANSPLRQAIALRADAENTRHRGRCDSGQVQVE